jgi:tRNA1(Val) A37 N6-methylase TrmN6
MRIKARLKLGYYPLAAIEAKRIRDFLQFSSEPASVLDPCAGTGAALRALCDSAVARTYGIELDSHRAEEARAVLDEVLQGSVFDAHAPVESFSLVYVNPPYDFEIGEGKNQRMERLFVDHVARWVRPGGVLILVVPYDRVYECRTVLTPQFKDKAVYRLTEKESVAYRQVVVFGVRRTHQERDRLSDDAVSQANQKLKDLTQQYYEIPTLRDAPDRCYVVPPSPPAKLDYRGIPLDAVEDLLSTSPAWRQSKRITHAPNPEFSGRPLTSLHQGHVALLCTSGMMNGCFGEGQDRHVAYWESVKVVDRREEEEDGAIVIHERERFSQRLTLLYADGRIALLSEKASVAPARKEEPDAECTLANGQADFCAPVAGHDNEHHCGSELSGGGAG